MSFPHMPAAPLPAVYDPSREQINAAADYGIPMGLNMQQHAWLTVYASVLADPGVTVESAARIADSALPITLKRLEELA